MLPGSEQLDHSVHAAAPKRTPLCVLVHDFEGPLNVGSVFRIADAFALEKVFLTGSTAVPPHPKIRKTARSTHERVPYSCERDPLSVVRGLRAEGYQIVSLELTIGSKELALLQVTDEDRVCLILGSENKGIPQQLLDASDAVVRIPMFGNNSSMNVAAACAIAAYEIALMLRGVTRATPADSKVVAPRASAADRLPR
jgi:tRNA G18 (ribose-2'-O)-methylase SpoU